MALFHPPTYSQAQLTIALSAMVMACGAAFVCSWLAFTSEASPRKGRLSLAAFLLMGGSVVTLGAASVYVQTGLQLQHAIGQIVAVHAHSGEIELLIRTPAGDDVSVQAASRSPYFALGRRVRIDYESGSRQLVGATFLSQSGEPVGTYRAHSRWLAYLVVAGGLLLVYTGIRRYGRPPQAVGDRTPRPANPAGAFVDSQSLLHLSTTRNHSPELEE